MIQGQNTGTNSITTYEVKNVKGVSLQIQQFSYGFLLFSLVENGDRFLIGRKEKTN